MGYSGALGTLIYDKNLKAKISCQTPFNHAVLGLKIIIRYGVKKDFLFLDVFWSFGFRDYKTKYCISSIIQYFKESREFDADFVCFE
jgi:hypothetical protein